MVGMERCFALCRASLAGFLWQGSEVMSRHVAGVSLHGKNCVIWHVYAVYAMVAWMVLLGDFM